MEELYQRLKISMVDNQTKIVFLLPCVLCDMVGVADRIGERGA